VSTRRELNLLLGRLDRDVPFPPAAGARVRQGSAAPVGADVVNSGG
jgi:hypothetical protein